MEDSFPTPRIDVSNKEVHSSKKCDLIKEYVTTHRIRDFQIIYQVI
jgi:hypothetical protein